MATPIWFKSLDFDIGGVSFSPSVYEAIAIVFLLFVLVLSLARLRHMYIRWSLSGWHAWFFMGFLFALILEGFFILGGRTFLTGVLGWKSAPKPILSVLDAGRAKLVNVLGADDEVPSSSAREKVSLESVVSDFQSLTPDEARETRSLICEP